MVTFFSPKANDIVGIDCKSLVKSLKNPNPREFPEKMLSIVGKKHIFQFNYNTSSKQGPVDFIFNKILNKPDTPQQIADKASGSATTQQPQESIETNEPQEQQVFPTIEYTSSTTTDAIIEVTPAPTTHKEHATQMSSQTTKGKTIESAEENPTQEQDNPVTVDARTTPPAYTHMQTRSKQGKQVSTQIAGDTSDKPTTAKRSLFQEKAADAKKSKKE